ncbi:hypothetical protein [Luteimonas cucumeris]|nr:hypothetical protein [Luteimonas cucumeris]
MAFSVAALRGVAEDAPAAAWPAVIDATSIQPDTRMHERLNA